MFSNKETNIISFPSDLPPTRSRQRFNLSTVPLEYPVRAAQLYQKLCNPRRLQDFTYPVHYYYFPDNTQYGVMNLDQDYAQIETQQVKLFVEWPAQKIIIDHTHKRRPHLLHNKPYSDMLIPHYNYIIAELAGIDIHEALEAVTAWQWPRSGMQREDLKKSLMQQFGVSGKIIEATFDTVCNSFSKEPERFVVHAAGTLEQMDQTANDISWFLLQKLYPDLQGNKVAILAGQAHAPVFRPEFQPEIVISAPQPAVVQSIFKLYEKGNQALAKMLFYPHDDGA